MNYAEKFSEATGIQIQSQHWGGNRKLSMEAITVEYFPTSVDTGNNEENFEVRSYISVDNEEDVSASHAHMDQKYWDAYQGFKRCLH